MKKDEPNVAANTGKHSMGWVDRDCRHDYDMDKKKKLNGKCRKCGHIWKFKRTSH